MPIKATREIGGIDPTHTQPRSTMWVLHQAPAVFTKFNTRYP